MTDREMLELAAKAASIRTIEWVEKFWSAEHADPDNGRSGCLVEFIHGEAYSLWNPLTNDGDALRLAVKLNLLVGHTKEAVYSGISDDNGYYDGDLAGESVTSSIDGQRLELTRRVIVQAAAEIGRKMAD